MALAYFSTWTSYGTWLPGDDRGWFKSQSGLLLPDALRRFQAALLMNDDAITLNPVQRKVVEKTIIDHCAIRKWVLHAVNCRTNHVHVLVTAPDRNIEIPREQFKAWCTRKLKAMEIREGPAKIARDKWWTERGWDEYVDDDESLEEVIKYIFEGQ